MVMPGGKRPKRYLVELRRPGRDGLELEELTARTRAATAALTRAGTPVRFLRAIFVPEDETCFFLLEAQSRDAVEQAARRAELATARTVESLRVGPAGSF
jgi:hypothetical protein